MKAYEVDVQISKQEDGLWRAEVPGLQGCFVDASTITSALSDIQGVVAMFVDYFAELEKPLPKSVRSKEAATFQARVLVALEEHVVKRPKPRRPRKSA